MRCAACAAEIPDSFNHCPHCGRTMEPAKASVRLDFGGTGTQALGWILLYIVASLAVIPLAWVQAAVNRWFCRNLKFGDGAKATFRGTGGQVVGWIILYFVVAVVFQLANRRAPNPGIGLSILLLILYLIPTLAITLKLIHWFVSNVELSSGPPLTFTGDYGQFLGWYFLLLLSGFTIIGWAWVVAAMYRWFARNTRGPGMEFQFQGKGHQILWRALVAALASVLIVPIPWMVLWLLRWGVQNVSFTRSGSVAAEGNIVV
jgi:uncharacterized membrane protein YjgN (DUF898 family)